MKFEADERLLELLVGSNLYPEPFVGVRELIQNAWDATEWRRARADGLGGEIAITFSAANRWFEVTDDGIGMSREDVKESFIRVGRNKLEALGADAPVGEQVAFFGIGVLSVFLLASSVDVVTRKVDGEPIEFTITGLKDDFQIRPGNRDAPGTSIRVAVKPVVQVDLTTMPQVVRQYVRHVKGVSWTNADTGESAVVADSWSTDQLSDVMPTPDDSRLRAGRVGFSRGLRHEGEPVRGSFTLCNAGFLVEDTALDVLPMEQLPLGLSGELDLHAGALNIAISRERFQRDDRWKDLQETALEWFEERALEGLRMGSLRRQPRGLDPPENRRNILIWYSATQSGPTFSKLRGELRDRLRDSVGFAIAEGAPSSLNRLIERLPAPRLYFRHVGGRSQVARSIDDEGLPIQLTEELRDSVRVGALRARGFPVLEAHPLVYTISTARGAINQRLDEADLIRNALEGSGVEVRDIVSALEGDLDLGSVERLPILRNLLNLPGGQLRFARVVDSTRRVVVDPSGIRYLNVSNPTVRRLLRTIPDAISNPLRRRLLDAYLGIEEFNIAETRELLLALLEDPNLHIMGQAQTAALTAAAVSTAVEELLQELEEELAAS